jgi:hypothetical protein
LHLSADAIQFPMTQLPAILKVIAGLIAGSIVVGIVPSIMRMTLTYRGVLFTVVSVPGADSAAQSKQGDSLSWSVGHLLVAGSKSALFLRYILIVDLLAPLVASLAFLPILWQLVGRIVFVYLLPKVLPFLDSRILGYFSSESCAGDELNSSRSCAWSWSESTSPKYGGFSEEAVLVTQIVATLCVVVSRVYSLRHQVQGVVDSTCRVVIGQVRIVKPFQLKDPDFAGPMQSKLKVREQG